MTVDDATHLADLLATQPYASTVTNPTRLIEAVIVLAEEVRRLRTVVDGLHDELARLGYPS